MALNETPRPDLSKSGRLKRIVELKCRGLSERSISTTMRGEGFEKIAVRTIDRLFAEVQKDHKEMIADELQRQQLLDISGADVGLRLKYRDKLLDKLLPPRPLPVSLTDVPNIVVTFDSGMKDKDEPSPPPG